MQISTLFRLSGALVVAATLAACAPRYHTGQSADTQRAAGGAGAGAGVAHGRAEDIATGAAIGGAAGALCDDARVCTASGF